MRTGIIEAITADGKHVVLASSNVALPTQKAMFKTARENNAKVDDVQYAKVNHFVSNAKVRTLNFRQPQAAAKPVVEGFVANIPALVDALDVDLNTFKKLRDANADTFPDKTEDGYDVAAVQAWVDGLATD